MGIGLHKGMLAAIVAAAMMWPIQAIPADFRGRVVDGNPSSTSLPSPLYQPLTTTPDRGLRRSPVPRRLYKLYRTMVNPVPDAAESVAKGELVYSANCQVCHGSMETGPGSNGGFTPGPVDLAERRYQATRSDGELFYAIRNGVDGTAMLPWGSRLSDRDIWMVVRYLRAGVGP